ncbi:MAG: EAL domain-containing protein [Synergistaceae bacterium]|nr:EAL domain-containing protein [Synergistaceae bacterium]
MNNNTADFFRDGTFWLLDDYSDGVYISDTESHRLLYMNSVGRRMFGIAQDADVRELLCHKVLQGRDAPCPFCMPERLSENRYYAWEQINKVIGRHVVMRDRLIKVNGRRLRLQTITEAETKEQMERLITTKIHTENTLLGCVSALADQGNINGVEKSVTDILRAIADFYSADRAYVLELERPSLDMRHTYEWCRAGIASEINSVSSMKLSRFRQRCFAEGTAMIVKDIETLKESDPAEYARQESRGVRAFYMVPYTDGDEVRGYVGVDNPSLNLRNFSMLNTLTLLIAHQMGQYRLRCQREYGIYHDTLTGLSNRNGYNAYKTAISEEQLRRVGVAVGNLNALDQQNRDFGTEAGDSTVKVAATCLDRHFSEDMLFRFEGDEFIIICEDITFPDFVARVEAAEKDICKKTSCGIAVGYTWSEKEILLGEMLHQAKLHMIEKKKLYYNSIEGKSKYNSKKILDNLNAEIAQGHFIVYVQPKITVAEGGLYGAEALIRYSSPDHGVIPPVKFIPTLEKEWLIRHIDFFVLEEVCKLIAKWIAEKRTLIPVSVNFSRTTLLESRIADRIEEIVDRYGIPHEYILIEITESAGYIEKDTFVSIGRILTGRGFSLSLDDFCSEYSCVSLLSALKFKEIKFDRSMISQLGSGEKTADTVCETMVGLCSKLGYPVVAEGVETKEQLEILKKFKCDAVQGFFFDRPMPAEEFEKKYIYAQN